MSLHTQAVDMLAEMIRNHQDEVELLIENLGITIRLADLQGWPEYAELREKMHSGFTSTRLYRLLFPKRHRRLWQSFIAAQLDLQQDFWTAVLEAGEKAAV